MNTEIVQNHGMTQSTVVNRLMNVCVWFVCKLVYTAEYTNYKCNCDFLSYNSDYVSCNYEEKNTELRYLNSELCVGGE